MKKAAGKSSDPSSDRPTPVELAKLAVAIAHWKGRDKPAFVEAEEIIEGARRHLSGHRQIQSREDYEKEMQRLGVVPFQTDESRQFISKIVRQEPARLEPKVDEIVQKLKNNKPHPEIREPQAFPASLISCLRLITGEKDPRRRAPWLAKAGVKQRKGLKVRDPRDYRIIAAKIVPHLPRFGAAYKKNKPAALPRDTFGKFRKPAVQRGARGRVKRITARDQGGRIAKNPGSSDF